MTDSHLACDCSRAPQLLLVQLILLHYTSLRSRCGLSVIGQKFISWWSAFQFLIFIEIQILNAKVPSEVNNLKRSKEE